jgi:glycosyltransferase involved in cell wall biosynthesis
VRHVDLSEGLPALARDPLYGGMFLVLWWRSTPLAHLELPAARLPLDSVALRERAIRAIAPTLSGHLRAQLGIDPAEAEADQHWVAHLSREPGASIEQLLSATKPAFARSRPSVSVVICTRDRPLQLARCLESLAQLSLSPDQILIVDNCPADADSARQLAAKFGADYVLEPEPGLDRARNAGVRTSRGAIVAYVDDDVTVHPQWLARLLEGFTDDAVMAVTGLVLPAELETRSQLLFERYWGFNRGYAPRVYDSSFYLRNRRYAVPVWEIGAGANMAFRRAAFELLGGFDQRLDAGAAGVAGDSEFWYRILFAGFICQYQPAACVFHWHRREMAQLQRQIRAYMRGHVTALLIQHQRYGDRGNLRRLVAKLPLYYAETALRAISPRHRERAGTLGAELAGCAAGLRYYYDTRDQAQSAVPVLGPRAHHQVQREAP